MDVSINEFLLCPRVVMKCVYVCMCVCVYLDACNSSLSDALLLAVVCFISLRMCSSQRRSTLCHSMPSEARRHFRVFFGGEVSHAKVLT